LTIREQERAIVLLQQFRGELRTLRIPLSASNAIPDRPVSRRYWSGHEWQLGSAAYWESITSAAERPPHFRLGRTFLEEVGACMLGGYGIATPIAHAAFERLQQAGVFADAWTADAIEGLLRSTFNVGGRVVRYRFPRQKAARLANALAVVRSSAVPSEPVAMRDWLTSLSGVGPKTASWIVRNHTGSNDVAIIDIHIIRAGIASGVFSQEWRVARDYLLFEQAFLQWARHAGLEASLLDACIWGVLAHAGASARDILGTKHLTDQPRPVWPVDDDASARLPINKETTRKGDAHEW
jgi:hypothetical protein